MNCSATIRLTMQCVHLSDQNTRDMKCVCFVCQRLHEGVVRDLERLERRKENLRLLEEQRTLTRQLEEERHHRETRPRPQDH